MSYNKITNLSEYRNRIADRLATHDVKPGTPCTQCTKKTDKMYSRMIFRDGVVNLCSRNCAVAYNDLKK